MSEFISILQNRSQSLIEQIRGNMSTAGINATGKTSQGLAYEIIQDGNNITLQVTANQFTQVIETGRKPTPEKKPSRSMIQNITDWAGATGLLDGSNTSIVWAIATQISKEGTRLWQQGGRKDIYTMPFEEFIKILQVDILAFETGSYIKTILKAWQPRPQA